MDETGEFQDWEVLHDSETGVVISSDYLKDFGGIEGDSEGIVRSDYFTLDSGKRYEKKVVEADDLSAEEGSAESDNPSWIEPDSESRYGNLARNEVGLEEYSLERKNSGEFWSDSGSDGSVSQKFMGFEGNRQLGCGDDVKGVEFERIGETGEFEVKGKIFSGVSSDSRGNTSVPVKFNGIEGENYSDFGDSGKMGYSSGVSLEEEVVGGSVSELGGVVEVKGGDGLDSSGFVEGDGGEVPEEDMGNVSSEDGKLGEGEKRGIVWWKLPLELLKFYVFRVNPVWTISIAALMMGFVILRRRLHKMKEKSRSIPLKIALEGKKVSQFMTRAARLNEAFSVVRRVPVVRPSLPTAGVTPWPIMSLR